MSIAETLLIFAGIPILVVLAVFAAVYGLSRDSGSRRYRPGRHFDAPAAWFVSSKSAGDGAPAIEGVASVNGGRSATDGDTGGASDRW